ncbi:hypothetical protein M406DRAFT_268649 [Cryphonectria parasitica EP155]|uniref:Distal membrane-arm assembly complex protein 1-like domain-containing protein n=1 Tax=Cryphonectria parasitica (strain ATCC 38755 / EP155) TaxID=660469 RepID=A0A9P4XTY1_CRYP1|nr:uncharacterized protein M406DRAFT_268649 [Cryphonectria parasitica EP155]KAF3760722.1 hypothetical protein M406DRAFT_268649 [Cryphonectria parasitica EP155]
MAGNSPSVHSLQQPLKADDLLKQERRDYDCTSCRIVGGTAFIGLAGYSYWEGMKQLEKNRASILKSKPWIGIRGRKAGLIGTSVGLAWMGIYRLFG